MEVLATIGLVILGIIVLIGIIRVILKPWSGFLDFILDIFLLDLLGDTLGWIFDQFSDLWD